MPSTRFTSLTLKLALPIALVLLVAIAAITSTQYLTNRRIVFDQVQNAGTNLLDILEETLVVSPELFHEERLNDIVLRFARSTPGVVRLSIADRSLTIIADSDTSRIGQTADYGVVEQALRSGQDLRHRHDHGDRIGFHIHHLIRSVYDPAEKTSIIGVATIEISAAPIQQELDFAFVMMAVIVIVVALLIGIAMVYFVRYLLITPVDVLSVAARRFGRGDFAHKIALDRRDELGELASTLNQMSHDLELNIQQRKQAEEELVRNERLAALGQLTGTVSHELRNPLGAMRTALAAIRKLMPDGEPMLVRSVEIVERSIVRCDNIVGDLLGYSRVRGLVREPTALDGWLAGLLDEYELPPGVTLRLDLETGAVPTFDRDRLRRVMINLLDNACQAMADEGDVVQDDEEHLLTVATRQTDGRAEISIADTGPGIPAELVDRIFEPLYSSKAFGVGLGLPIVKQIVEQHGGGIDLDSGVGSGTRFVIRLPLPVPDSVRRAAS
jgi:signal transduction histidine kinase